MDICLGRGADLHMAQLMPLPPTVSCFSKILIGFFLVLAHWGSPRQRAVKRVLLLLLLKYIFFVLDACFVVRLCGLKCRSSVDATCLLFVLLLSGCQLAITIPSISVQFVSCI